MDKEFYSKGSHAQVEVPLLAEQRYFAEADLVRREPARDPFWFGRLYFIHKVAKLLHPDSFINVHAVTCTPNEAETGIHNTRVFSEKAAVPEDHAVFSKHMNHFMKTSLCKCEICMRHRKFHGLHDLRTEAYHKNIELNKTGIGIHWPDESDYCLSDKGLVFFEIDGFTIEKIKAHAETLADDVRGKVFRSLERFAFYKEQSRLGYISGRQRSVTVIS